LLKDAAAASIWGARAGNGVIVITTKKLKGQDRVAIEYSTNLNFTEKPDLLYYPDMRSSDFIEAERFLFEKGHYDAAYNGTARTKNNTVFSPVVDLLFKEREGQLNSGEVEQAIASFNNIDHRYEMMDIFYRKPFRQQHFVGMGVHAQNFSSRFSIGYDASHGDQIGNKSNRLSLRSTNRLELSTKLSVEGGISYSGNTAGRYGNLMDHNYSPGGGKSRLYPYAQYRNEKGEPLPVPSGYNMEYVRGLQGSPLLDWMYYPVNEIGTVVSDDSQKYLQTQLKLDYKPVEGLALSALYNTENQTSDGESLYREHSFYIRNLVNRFTQIDGDKVTYVFPLGAMKSSSRSILNSYNVRGQATYTKQFFDGHDIHALLGGEVSNRRRDTRGFWVHGFDEYLLTSQVVDPVNTYPIYDGLSSNSTIPQAGANNHSYDIDRFVSMFFNAGYTYLNRYGASFSTRRDASNLFGVKTNDKWKPLWSAGVNWLLHNERFIRDMEWISSLKIRMTYGHSGSSGGVANTLPIILHLKPEYGALTQLPRASLTTLSNPNLRWEDVRMINAGIDFSLWDGKINGSLEAYNKKSTDLLANDLMDITTGYQSITRNVGELRGKGIDIRLSSGYGRGGLKGNTTVNFSANTTEVTKFYGTNFRGSVYAENTGSSIRPVLGKQLYPVFSFKFSGLDPETGDPRGILNGETSKDYTMILNDSIQYLNYHGTALPPYYGSVIQQLTWKGVTLSFLIAYKFGHFFQKETIRYNDLFQSWIGHRDYADRWQQAGDEQRTTVPSMIYPAIANRDRFYAASEPNILSGDIIRLQDVGLDYRLRTRYGQRNAQLNLFFKVNNVGILWRANSKALDPDYDGLPPGRRYVFGISVNL